MPKIVTDAAAMLVCRATAGESGRYAINGVLVEPDGTAVGTCGRALVAVQGPAGGDATAPVIVSDTTAEFATRATGFVEITGTVRWDDRKGTHEVPEKQATIDGTYPKWRDMLHGGTYLRTFGADILARTLHTVAAALDRLTPNKSVPTVRLILQPNGTLEIHGESFGRHVVALVAPTKVEVEPVKGETVPAPEWCAK